MIKLFMFDASTRDGCAKSLACAFYNRIKQEIPSLEMVLEKNSSLYEFFPTDYDLYLFHLSETNIEKIYELRENKPSAFIIGMSGIAQDEYSAGMVMHSYREKNDLSKPLFDLIIARDCWDETLERLMLNIPKRFKE